MIKTGLKIAWGITGSGDYMEESISLMKRISNEDDVDIKVFLSKSGEQVVRWYKLWESLEESFPNLSVEKGPNTPFIAGQVQIGKFDLLLICPSTGNTTAKIACGIADTLVTNTVSQAMKGRVPVYIYPVDQNKGDVVTSLPDGKELTLTMREVDIENVERIKKMNNIFVIKDVSEIEEIVKSFKEGNK
ncbi:MAG: archaeoflavoprotein AfpA [Halobacteriota archaeon]|nr:archaeoflavoprotein AfpA [Halobacteriota archaeon]